MTNIKTTTKRTMKAPKTPKAKVSKEVVTQFESNELEDLKNNKAKDNGKDTIETKVEESKIERSLEELNDELESIQNIELEDSSDNNEDIEENEENVEYEESGEEDLFDGNEENKGDTSDIMSKEEFAKLTFEEQVKTMKSYRKSFTAEDIKKFMNLQTTQYYKLLEKLGLHKRKSMEELVAMKSQEKAKKQGGQTMRKAKQEITMDFNANGVTLQGDLDLQDLLERINGLVAFGGGEENFEFKFELIRK